MARLIALFLFILYLLTFSGVLHSSDAFSALAVTENVVNGRPPDTRLAIWQQYSTPNIAGAQGVFDETYRLYSKRGILHSLLPAPLFVLGGLDPALGRVHLALLTNALATALTGALVYLTAREAGCKTTPAALGALAFGLTTPAWPYARYLFGEPIIGLGLAMGAYGIMRLRRGGTLHWAVLVGAGVALGAGVNLGALVALPAALWAAWVEGGRENRLARLVALVAPVAAMLALVGAYNAVRFSSPLELGRLPDAGEWFNAPLHQTIPALVLSPARGLLWYNPLIWLGLAWGTGRLFQALRAREQKEPNALPWYLTAVVVLYLALYGAWYMWWGGFAWGPRFLVPLSPLVALAALPALARAHQQRSWWRAGTVMVTAAALAVQFLGVARHFGHYEILLADLTASHTDTALYPYGLNALYTPTLSPIVAHARFFITQGINDIAWFPPGAFDWTALLPLVIFAMFLTWLMVRTIQEDVIDRWLMAALIAVAAGLAGWVMLLNSTHPLDPAHLPQPELDLIAAEAAPGDGALIYVPELTKSILNNYPLFPPTWGMPPLVAPDPALESALDAAQRQHKRLWVVSWFDPLDPHAWAEAEIAQTHYALGRRRHAQEEGFWIGQYLIRKDPGDETWQPADWTLETGLHLQAYALAPGPPLRVALRWEALEEVTAEYIIFVHALDADGRLLAQSDHPPQNGFRPTWSWEAGETVIDRVAIPLNGSEETAQTVLVGMYDWLTPEDRLEGETPGGKTTTAFELTLAP